MGGGGSTIRTEHTHHPRLGDITKVSNGKEEHLRAEVAVADSIEADRWEEGLRLARLFKNNKLFLPFSYELKRSNYCGSSRVVELNYENFNTTLNNEILERANRGQHYRP
jgi:hypothetical protein